MTTAEPNTWQLINNNNNNNNTLLNHSYKKIEQWLLHCLSGLMWAASISKLHFLSNCKQNEIINHFLIIPTSTFYVATEITLKKHLITTNFLHNLNRLTFKSTTRHRNKHPVKTSCVMSPPCSQVIHIAS